MHQVNYAPDLHIVSMTIPNLLLIAKPVQKEEQSNSNVHPFLLEWVVEEKRRKSAAIVDREMIMNYVSNLNDKEIDKSSNFDLNETYMMFGGKEYIKVGTLVLSYFWHIFYYRRKKGGLRLIENW